MKSQAMAVAVILGIVILGSFLRSLDFSNTGLPGLIGEGVFTSSGPENQYPVSQDEVSVANTNNPVCMPIFTISGLDAEHTHLRTGVSSEYRGGRWIMEDLSYSDSQGVELGKIFSVTPLATLQTVPVPKDTVSISLPSGYNRSAGVFNVEGNVTRFYGVYVSDLKTYENAALAKIDLDQEEFARIKSLAEEITKNATDDYEKARLIEEYLKSSYEYSPYFNDSGDMIYDFLFVEKKGICVHFASAFVALATAVDLPARAVFGYLAKPASGEQVVYSCQAHMWAEVRIGDRWIEFDPTPPYRLRIPTETSITSWSSEIIAGQPLNVTGTVKLMDGRAVESGYVEIYLKKDKNSSSGELIGISRITNGSFSLSKVVNETGRFSIVAHYTGSLLYSDSWSDPEVVVYEKTEILINLNDPVPTEFLLKGSVTCSASQNESQVIIYVDGVEKTILTEKNGSFSIPVKLPEGEHEIRVLFPRQGLCAEASLEKHVRAGTLKIVAEPPEITAGEGNTVAIHVNFNEEPYEGLIEVNGEVYRINGTLNLTLKPESPGPYTLNFRAGGLETSVTLSAKARTIIKAEEKNGYLEIRVSDSFGSRLNGTVFVNDVPVELRNGVAVAEKTDGRAKIKYPGDRYHFPAEIEYSQANVFMYLIPPVLLAPAIYVYYYRFHPRLEVKLEKEYPELPDIWGVGEEIEVSVRSNLPYTITSDSRILSNRIAFDSPGPKEITVSAIKDGRVRKKTKVAVLIVEDYGKGVEEVYRMFENEIRRKGVDPENLTAREIMILVKSEKREKFLRLFELYEYAGKRQYSRQEFVEAFEIYTELRRSLK
ncbi:transglutaminase domain-containing protein [Geoglobus acetivorans]|uniref:Transglutaminase-like domain-containing protein n=1 Tax=Geoglobus acetivorans TaxID=565033 RepID=A0ABZ3H3G3_GEOAI|nr:transglutaminase domain-containing protein [Geoglobus acetivorans]